MVYTKTDSRGLLQKRQREEFLTMGASKVYFADFRTTLTENLQQKLWRLLDKAGMGTIDFDKKYAAIKMHFG